MFQVWEAMTTLCLCTAKLGMKPSCCAPLPPPTAPPSPGPSSGAVRCVSPRRWSRGRWTEVRKRPVAWLSPPTAPSSFEILPWGTWAPTFAWSMRGTSLRSTCPSSPSALPPTSWSSGRGGRSSWAASSLATMMQETAGSIQAAVLSYVG